MDNTITAPASLRWCFYIPADAFVEGSGYVPAVVTENRPGYAPLTGNGRGSSPWFWGKTYAEALAVCAEQNARLGIDPATASDIVCSSMRAGRR